MNDTLSSYGFDGRRNDDASRLFVQQSWLCAGLRTVCTTLTLMLLFVSDLPFLFFPFISHTAVQQYQQLKDNINVHTAVSCISPCKGTAHYSSILLTLLYCCTVSRSLLPLHHTCIACRPSPPRTTHVLFMSSMVTAPP